MPTDDRDRELERALARHLSNASPDRACPDAEILAAFHERSLSLEEMAQWKEHIAGCARCQEALALIEESESVLAEKSAGEEVEVLDEEMVATAITTEAAALGSRGELRRAAAVAAESRVSALPKSVRHLPWRWVVPVGALAAAVMVWIGVREVQIENNKVAKQNIQVAENREATRPPLAPAPTAPTLDDKFERKESSRPRSEVLENPSNRITPPASKVVQPPREEQRAGGIPSASPKPGPSQPVGALTRDDREQSVSKAAPAQTPAPSRGDAGKRRALDVAPAPPAPVGGVGGAPVNQPAEAKKQKDFPQSTETVEVTAAAPALNTSTADLQVRALNENGLVRLAAEDHRFVVAPGQKQAWRVGEGGAILHSTDGGKTWKKQNSGVTVDLTSGSATSDKVAWVAGKNGALLLTTDGGKHWKQITTPIKEDLGGVHAVDRTHASIWDVTNRKSFETSDGGETWKPSANE
jgi:Photosynthesis system II assembly factor YCF48